MISLSGCVKTDGTAQTFCGPCGHLAYYSYHDTEPKGGDGTDCPNSDGSCSGLGSCNGSSVKGFIYSAKFPADVLKKGKGKALIYSGGCIDNYGSIGFHQEISTSANCPNVTYVANNTLLDAEISGDKLRIPVAIYNDKSGGPYGLCGLGVFWYIE